MDEQEKMNCGNCYYSQNGKRCYHRDCKEKYGSYWEPRKELLEGKEE